jgi:hypothetical protein
LGTDAALPKVNRQSIYSPIEKTGPSKELAVTTDCLREIRKSIFCGFNVCLNNEGLLVSGQQRASSQFNPRRRSRPLRPPCAA